MQSKGKLFKILDDCLIRIYQYSLYWAILIWQPVYFF